MATAFDRLADRILFDGPPFGIDNIEEHARALGTLQHRPVVQHKIFPGPRQLAELKAQAIRHSGLFNLRHFGAPAPSSTLICDLKAVMSHPSGARSPRSDAHI
ncbi:MAG: hypothetical protein Q8M24_16420 [Pseudolabrys sp.]|nr:hypothetical protein [Pseudolabrys sp.]MDP2297029.1 hypothetical protein [Pseudolabrys sp.]